MKLLDGRRIAKDINKTLKSKVMSLKENGKGLPHLVVFQYGENKISERYTKMIKKNCVDIGIKFTYKKITNNLEVFKRNLIEANNDDNISSIIVQQPFPKELNSCVNSIAHNKDVEGITPKSLGNLLLNLDTLIPATAEACMKILDYYDIPLKGKKVTVVGRSNIVGKPISILLQQRDATVTICHSKTNNLELELKNADIVIVAIGQAEMIKGHMLHTNSIVIDVGTNFVNGRLVGDVDLDSVKNKIKMITPVPHGVGVVTNQVLMNNIVKSFLNNG